MVNPKNDQFYIQKIIDDIDFIINHTNSLTLEDLSRNEVLVDSIIFRFIQISENAQNLTEDFLLKTNSLPWHELKGIRNRIVHAYDIVRVDIVFDTIKNDLIPFKENLKQYL